MSAIDFTVALPGLEALTVGLSRFRTDIADWRPFWTESFGPSFYYQQRLNFVSEGANSGPRWPFLSKAYAEWKHRNFPGKGILERSGVLKASLMGKDAPFAIFRPTPSALEIGTSVPYAIYHQLGGKFLPQRPPMRVDRQWMVVQAKSIQQFVQKAWVKRRQEWAAVDAAFAHSDTGWMLGGA